jgi:nucleoside phosphorylase
MVHGVDVVIITALPKERDAVLRRLSSPRRESTRDRVFYHSVLKADDGSDKSVILLPLSAMGNTSAAVAATQAIDVWNPAAIVLTGIAGGIKLRVKGSLGDVIVAEQIVAYEPGKLTPGGLRPRPDVYRTGQRMLTMARDFSDTDWQQSIDEARPAGDEEVPQTHFGVVASGEKVIADADFIGDLVKYWDRALAVEMEAVGVARATYERGAPPEFLFVKSISDWADSAKDDAWQPYAADVAAAFTCAFIKSEFFSLQRRTAQPQRSSVRELTGRHKILLCRRLGDDWHELADYFDIQASERRVFPLGRECQAIWEWLHMRGQLGALADALKFIRREDLVTVLDDMV